MIYLFCVADDSGGNGFRVEGRNGPSLHIVMPSLNSSYCKDDVCEYYVEARPMSTRKGEKERVVCRFFFL